MRDDETAEYARASAPAWHDGEVHGVSWSDGKEYPIARWCSNCAKDHGSLWTCPKYSDETKESIKHDGTGPYRDRFPGAENLRPKDWLIIYGEWDPKDALRERIKMRGDY